MTNLTGVDRIALERRRQIEVEGWTPDHDDEHAKAEMIAAAMSYLLHTESLVRHRVSAMPAAMWPWNREQWKPSEYPIRNLVKAGALIAAEIDRLIRLKEKGRT